MNSCMKSRVLLSVIVAIVAILVLGNTAFGQCSMCRAALGGSNNPFFIRNFNIGVLVLLLPPVTIFCSIFVVLKRHRTANDHSADEDQKSGVGKLD